MLIGLDLNATPQWIVKTSPELLFSFLDTFCAMSMPTAARCTVSTLYVVGTCILSSLKCQSLQGCPKLPA